MSRETVAMVLAGDVAGAREWLEERAKALDYERGVLAREQWELARQLERLVKEVELMRCELNEELAALRRAVARVRR